MGSFYTFETWADQLNDFCADVVKEKAFFICNSIGGEAKSFLTFGSFYLVMINPGQFLMISLHDSFNF